MIFLICGLELDAATEAEISALQKMEAKNKKSELDAAEVAAATSPERCSRDFALFLIGES